MIAHVPSFGRNPRGSPDFLAYPVPKACMHVLGTGVPRCLGVAHSASSPKAAQALGCSLTPRLQILFGRVTCMARAASVPGLWTLGFLLLSGVCALVRVAFGLGIRLRPATPGWGEGVCVCLCARSACTPPLLAGVCGVGVCAWARVSAAPRHSWLGCWGVCVFLCPLRLYPATPGWGLRRGCMSFGVRFRLHPATPGWGVGVFVCLCARSACTPPLLAGVCAVSVCVLGLWFLLHSATPGWGVGVCGCWCAHSACTPPFLAGVCRVGVCPRARGFGCPLPLLAGVLGVCAFVCPLCLYPATFGWDSRRVCVCLGLGFGCAPPLLAGVLGCVCVGVRAPLVPRHSWLGCGAWVCVWARVPRHNTPTHAHNTATPTPQASPGQERKTGGSTHGPPPGVASNQPLPPAVDPSQEWRGTAAKTLSQVWWGTSHHHTWQTPARSGGELHPRPSPRSGEGPPTTHTNHTHTNTSRKPEPREAGTSNHRLPTHQAHAHTHTSAHGKHTNTTPQTTQTPQTQKTDKSTSTTGNCPRHKHTQHRTLPTPTKQPIAASGPQPGVAGNRNQDLQPEVARDHTPPPTADPGQK